MAARLSARLGWLSGDDEGRVMALVERAGLPTAPPHGLGAERFLDLMAVDKKVQDGRLRLVLLRGIGRAVVTDDFPHHELTGVLDSYCP